MNDQANFLREVIELLEKCNVAYMVSGSIASSFFGEPRATRDVDLVIDCDEKSLRQLIDQIARSGWYVSDEAAMSALRERGMFNIIDPNSGWKADLIVRKDREYSIREFERRSPQPLFVEEHTPVPTVTPEDALLSKLEWCKASGHEQQLKDAESIGRVEGSNLDWDYLNYWANILEVRDLLEQLRQKILKQ